MDSEFYTGWLTHWGDALRANTSVVPIVKWLNNIMIQGGNFNLYMSHGGTSFGFWSGANGHDQVFQPDVTSYDYDAPIAEGGEHGYGSNSQDKFLAIQQLLVEKIPLVFAGS